MGNGDQAHNGDEPSRVRILPSEGVRPLVAEPSPVAGGPRRPSWVLPFVVGLVAVGVVLVTVHGLGSQEVATTQAPSMSGFEDEYIDLRPGDATHTGGWTLDDLPRDVAVVTGFAGSDHFVVTGDTGSSAMAWFSTTGSAWRVPSRFQLPESGESRIEQVASWQGSIIALGPVEAGVGVWHATGLYAWDYEGEIAGMASVDALVAGRRILAVGKAEDGTRSIWLSDDGLGWAARGTVEGLDEMVVSVFAADDSWYYAGGREACAGGNCRPVIYRSADGITWEPTSGAGPGVLAAEPGAIHGIVDSGDGLYAVGTVADGAVALWHSADGSDWTRIGEDSPVLPMSETTIRLVSTSPGVNPTAVITIDADRYTVGIGTRIATLSGDVVVDEITDAGIEVDDGDAASQIMPDGSVTLQRSIVVDSISAQGSRLLLAGTATTKGGEAPAVWTSRDSGRTWQQSVLAPAGGIIAAATSGRYLVAIGTTPGDGFVAWYTTWDTTQAQDDGLAAMQGFVRDLNARDFEGLIAALAEHRDSDAPSFAIPSLSATDPGWWDHNGDRDPAAVADTVEYLDALATEVTIDDCNTRSPVEDPDMAIVNCAFGASSELLTVVGVHDDIGRIEGTFVDGSLEGLATTIDPYTRVWTSLQGAAATASPSEQATLLATDDLGQSVLRPTFNRETAATHLQIAERFAAGQLRPGQTVTLATIFGPMEWRWLELPIPVQYVEGTAYLEATDEFVLIGHDGTGELAQRMSVWTSQDGLAWEEQPAPPGVQSIWDLRPIGDDVVGQAWSEYSLGLAFFDGTEWTQVSLGTNSAGTWPDFSQFAINGDTALVVARYWSERDNAPSEPFAWLVDADRTVHSVPPPPQTDDWQPANLAGSGDGYVLTLIGAGPGEIAVWHSNDGESWSLLGELGPLGTTPYLWNLQFHGSRYFVVGEEFDCVTGEEGDECQDGLRLFSSPDGVAWDLVTTISGEPVETYEVGSGPLGLAAIEQPVSDESQPRWLYLSGDGSAWEQAGDLAFFDPTADWWWTSRPAVGSDMVIVPGSSYQEAPDTERTFLLVGRLVDP